jgi:hypothetical protein
MCTNTANLWWASFIACPYARTRSSHTAPAPVSLANADRVTSTSINWSRSFSSPCNRRPSHCLGSSTLVACLLRGSSVKLHRTFCSAALSTSFSQWMTGHAVAFGVIPPSPLTCNNIKSDNICYHALAIML